MSRYESFLPVYYGYDTSFLAEDEWDDWDDDYDDEDFDDSDYEYDPDLEEDYDDDFVVS